MMDIISDRFEYDLRDVTGLTGLSKQVLHAWERRYDIVRPKRGNNATRVYSDQEVRYLQLLGKCTGAGHRIGKLASLDPETLKQISLECCPDEIFSLDDILSAASSLDTNAIENRLSTHFASLGPVKFARCIVVPLMARVGDLWVQGQLSVEAEHYVSSLIRTLLGQGLRFTGTSDTKGVAIFTTPEGELHELGALTAAILAQSCNVRALYLGAQLPAKSIATAAKSLGADVVCLSSTLLPRTVLEERISEVTSELAAETELWLGGQAMAGLRDVKRRRTTVFHNVPDYLDFIQRFRVRAARR